MKHDFVLDENILYFAVRGVDAYNNCDLTSAGLVLLIAENCHTVTATSELRRRYERHLAKLESERARGLPPLFLANLLMKSSAKLRLEYGEPPHLPIGAKVPDEDVHVVRAALMYRSLLVTGDRELREAISAQPRLGLRALSPQEALELAREQ